MKYNVTVIENTIGISFKESKSHIVIRVQAGVDHIVKRIIEKVQVHRSIKALRIIAHGNAGSIYLKGSESHRFKTTDMWSFECLKPYMAHHGFCELHSCGVASATSVVGSGAIDNPECVPGTDAADSDGRSMLWALSVALGVPVTAGFNCQTVEDNDDFEFEGPTLKAYPNRNRMKYKSTLKAG